MGLAKIRKMVTIVEDTLEEGVKTYCHQPAGPQQLQ